jgi:hypothetical protein
VLVLLQRLAVAIAAATGEATGEATGDPVVMAALAVQRAPTALVALVALEAQEVKVVLVLQSPSPTMALIVSPSKLSWNPAPRDVSDPPFLKSAALSMTSAVNATRRARRPSLL